MNGLSDCGNHDTLGNRNFPAPGSLVSHRAPAVKFGRLPVVDLLLGVCWALVAVLPRAILLSLVAGGSQGSQ